MTLTSRASNVPAGPKLTVLIPEGLDVSVLTDAAPDAHALEYRFDAALPDGAQDARVLVVGGSDTDDAIEALGRLPGVELVQTLNAGYDRWLGRLPDGIALSNARGAIGRTVAEWVVAVLLANLRELPRFAADQARGEWRPRETGTLNGRRVLVLGAGDLATSLRDQLAPFGAGVTLTGRTPREGVRSLADLDDLAGEADVLVAMLPLSDETAGIVNAKLLARLPDGATVVNVGRGPLVVTDHLVAELRSGRLRAALDVTNPEPLPPGHPLWTLPGVVITPHVAGGTTGWRARMWEVACTQIAQFAAGRRPDNTVL